MDRYNRDLVKMERKLLKEISGMKFSFKKLKKLIELDSVLSLCNR